MEQYKVLLIEDDDTAREQLARVIKKEGFTVLIAMNGQEGLDLFKSENPHIIITDIKMPHIDGMEVLYTVKKLSPFTQVILITGHGEVDTAISALHEGAMDYLKKPLDLDLLFLALGRAKEKVNEFKNVVLYPTLLIAEDDQLAREKLTIVLEKENWKVVAVANGEEAMEVFQKQKIDIALLDIKMPKMDGLTTLHRMREITTDFEVIVLTGYGDEASAITALRDGATNFLKKPIDLDQIIVTIEKAIDKLNSTRALKFRIRELELAHELIAKITSEKEIVIDTRKYSRQDTRNFAMELLNSIPVGLIAVMQNLKIKYTNQFILEMLGYTPTQIDEEFIQKLTTQGMTDLNFAQLKTEIKTVLNSPDGVIKMLKLDENSFITLVSVFILEDEKNEKAVILVMKGKGK